MKFNFFLFFGLLVLLFASCSEPCEKITCVNGSVCVDGTCQCTDGYTGESCQTPQLFAYSDSATVFECVNPFTFNVINNDNFKPNVGFKKFSLDLNPTVTGVQDSVVIPNQGTFKTDSVGNVKFTHLPGFLGKATATYQVADTSGTISNVAKVIINVKIATPVLRADNLDFDYSYNTTPFFDLFLNDESAPCSDLDYASLDLDATVAGNQTSKLIKTTTYGDIYVEYVASSRQFYLHTPSRGTRKHFISEGFTAEFSYSLANGLGQRSSASVTVAMKGERARWLGTYSLNNLRIVAGGNTSAHPNSKLIIAAQPNTSNQMQFQFTINDYVSPQLLVALNDGFGDPDFVGQSCENTDLFCIVNTTVNGITYRAGVPAAPFIQSANVEYDFIKETVPVLKTWKHTGRIEKQ